MLQVWLALINLPMYLAEKETDPAEKEKLWNQASENIDRAEKSIGDRAILRRRGALSPFAARTPRRSPC